jgi:hypothetical protein
VNISEACIRRRSFFWTTPSGSLAWSSIASTCLSSTVRRSAERWSLIRQTAAWVQAVASSGAHFDTISGLMRASSI